MNFPRLTESILFSREGGRKESETTARNVILRDVLVGVANIKQLKGNQIMYGLFGKMRAQPGQREVLIGHLLRAADMLRDLESCLLYIINSDPTDPDGIWVTEVWQSQADHQASLTHDAIRSLITMARPLIAEMPLRYEVTPLGGKGLTGNAP